MDVARDPSKPSGYEVVIDGGRTRTGSGRLEWARKAEYLGAGEIVLNSIDADGTRDGYELTVTRLVSRSVGIPVVASGGAGKPEHLVSVFKEAGADAALIASMVHYGEWTVRGIKEHLARERNTRSRGLSSGAGSAAFRRRRKALLSRNRVVAIFEKTDVTPPGLGRGVLRTISRVRSFVYAHIRV